MSTPHKAGRAKPVTLAKSASGKPEPVAASKAGKTEHTKSQAAQSQAAKPEAAKPEAVKPEAVKPDEAPKPVGTKPPKAKADAVAPSMPAAPTAAAALDGALPAAWNELVKAQSEAALAWWQDAKDARTFADALAVNARHSRLQFEIVAGQAREMAAHFQKAFESSSERFRALFDQPKH